MAYENGRKINRYAASQIGKRKQKKSNSSRKYHWNGRAEYWKKVYYSKPRKYAKRETNRKLRQSCAEIPDGAGYRKVFDYEWTIW